jgi:multicomponent Na+:H+ antiporter subunit D
MWFTAALFILGACGLAGVAPFGTLLGESMISSAAKEFHQGWLIYIFMFAEVITAAAVLRATFRIFFGWGKPAPTDESSEVEELPETEKQPGGTPTLMFAPAAALILLGVCITFIPQLRSVAHANASEFMNQTAYAREVLDSAQLASPQPQPAEALASSIIRSSLAALLALLLALGTVFRDKFGAILNFTRRLEIGNSMLRQVHSGHPGDYVAWLTFGTALLGGMFVWWLR